MAQLTKKQKALQGKVDSNKLCALTAADLDAAVRTIAGSARSMGVTVEGV